MSRPGRPTAARTPAPAVPVEAVILNQPVTGLRNPPCCGRACAPRLTRTRIVGSSRIADGCCPWCGHRLRITYERRADGWHPVLATDLSRGAPRQA